MLGPPCLCLTSHLFAAKRYLRKRKYLLGLISSSSVG